MLCRGTEGPAFSAVAATVSLSFSNFWIASLMLVAFAIAARQLRSNACRDAVTPINALREIRSCLGHSATSADHRAHKHRCMRYP